MSLSIARPFAELTTARTKSFLFMALIAMLCLVLPTDVFAQSADFGSTTSGIDKAVCAFLKLMQRFGFYILMASLIIIAFAIKMGEGRDIVIRSIQLIGGIWILLNVVTIGDLITGGRLAASFQCTLA